MYGWVSQQLSLSPEHKRMLQDQTIRDDGPGTLLQDFQVLLSFIQERELPVTGKLQLLPMRVLREINARLAQPIQLGLKRPQQKSYPHIHGLYLLVRATGLTSVGGTHKKALLIVDDAVERAWANLNPTECYFTLLETWLLRGLPEIIGEGRRGYLVIPDSFGGWASFFGRIPDEGLQIAGDKDAKIALSYWPGWHNLGLLDLFGLISVEHGPPQPGEGWRIERIHRTALGEALLALLYVEFFSDFDNLLQFEGEGEIPFGVLQPTLQPYFTEWEENLVVPGWTFREGAYVFKVSLGEIWRRIAIPATLSLDELAAAILNAFEFDHDHLYQFSYRNRFGALERINHPYMDEGPWASEVLIGDMPLGVGQQMMYRYDFGDNWEFDVTLERIDPVEESVKKPTVLDRRGESPEQYPRWGEW